MINSLVVGAYCRAEGQSPEDDPLWVTSRSAMAGFAVANNTPYYTRLEFTIRSVSV